MIEDELKDVVINLKACISSRKGGVPFRELNEDYRELLGESIPFKKFGHRDLREFLSSIPGVYVDDVQGTVRTTPTANTLHLHALIAKQKDKVKKIYNNKKYKPDRKTGASHQVRYDRNCAQPPSHSNKQSHNLRYYKNDQKSNCDSYEQKQQLSRDYEYEYQIPVYKTNYNKNYQTKDDTYEPKLPPSWENSETSQKQWSNGENLRQEVWFNCTDERKPQSGRQFFDGRHISYDNNKLSINRNEEYNWLESHISENSIPNSDSYILSYQVIGDALSMLVLGCHPCTYCVEDMTVEDATIRVLDFGCPNKVLIALGTVDILKGRTATELILDMQILIKTILKTGAKVLICTLPPVPTIRGSRKRISYVIMFNNWVRRFKHGADVIDLNNLFKDERSSINYNLFEKDSVRIPGCKLPMSLWNEFGLNLVAKELVYHCCMNF